MDTNIITTLLITILPILELRAGIPLILTYYTGTEALLLITIATLLNALIILPLFYFLDNIHEKLLHLKAYKKTFGAYQKRIEKKAQKLETQLGRKGYITLTLFVSIPLPGTGAWTGTALAWFLRLNRRKSIAAIMLGVLLSSIFVTFTTLGILKILT